MNYVIINERYCDNSQYCWFLKNCPSNVFSYENGKIKIDEKKCIGCRICVGHCSVVMIAKNEIEKKQCVENLNAITFDDNSNCIVFGTEPFAADNMFDVNCDSSKQIEIIKNNIRNSEKNLVIELSCNNALSCRYVGIRMSILNSVILNEIGSFEYKVIFTGNNEKAFNDFCDFFELDSDIIARAPLLIFYNKGKVYGTFGHGPLHFKNFDLDKFRNEMQKIGENYVNK